VRAFFLNNRIVHVPVTTPRQHKNLIQEKSQDSQNEIRVSSEIPESVRREYHGLATPQFPQTFEEIYFASL
jgi:hypothetical protein